MNLKFSLKEPNNTISPLRLILSHKGKVYRKQVGVKVKTKHWNDKKQRSGDPETDHKLREIRLELMQVLNDESTEPEIFNALDSVTKFKSLESSELLDFFKSWSERDMSSKKQRQNCYNIIATIFPHLTYDDVDSRFYCKLIDEFNKRGFSRNYQGQLVSKLKTMMNEAYKLKYHTNLDFKEFKRTSEVKDSAYLSEDELEMLWNCGNLNETQRKVRDLFLIGVYTASRFSDYSRINEKNIVGKTIRFTQRKTFDSVIIPLSSKVRVLLERNGWKSPRISQPKFNGIIKEVCRIAGIDTPFEVTESRGDKHTTKTVPKWQVISSHTARRTGATLLYMSGVPIKSCMLITGHRSQSTFLNYVKITKEENANTLMDNTFFK